MGFGDETIENTNEATSISRFRDHYYADPRTVELVYLDLSEDDDDNVNPKHLLLSFYYLKRYPTKHGLAAFLDETEKTGLKWAHIYVRKIQKLKEKKIKWLFDDDNIANHPENFILSVDGIHCQIFEPRITPSTGWFSSKYNKAGLVYEIGIAIYHNQVVWIAGPYPAGHNDIMIFKRPNGLAAKVPPGKKVVADEGYQGSDVVALRNQFDIAEVKEFKQRVKARHETFNSRLKAFDIISQAFRTTYLQVTPCQNRNRHPLLVGLQNTCLVFNKFRMLTEIYSMYVVIDLL